MKIENQVCTLEQAKKLKELGVEQNTLFQCLDYGEYHLYEATANGVVFFEKGIRNPLRTSDYKGVYALFTVAELAIALKVHMPYWVTIWGEWGYKDCGGVARGYENLAHAATACLIDRLENKKITPEEVNKRLTPQTA